MNVLPLNSNHLTLADIQVPANNNGLPGMSAFLKIVGALITFRLLTQNYQQPRADLVSWVQAESASSTEPRVVGLVPENLRPKLAVYSVTESSDGSAVPVPSPAIWPRVCLGHSSVLWASNTQQRNHRQSGGWSPPFGLPSQTKLIAGRTARMPFRS
jgi:hypothetical protein